MDKRNHTISYDRLKELLGTCMDFLAEGAQEYEEVHQAFNDFGFTDHELQELGFDYVLTTIRIETYGDYHEESDEQDVSVFEVPRDWLSKYLQEHWYTEEAWKVCGETVLINEWLHDYIWDDGIAVFNQAEADGVIINKENRKF